MVHIRIYSAIDDKIMGDAISFYSPILNTWSSFSFLWSFLSHISLCQCFIREFSWQIAYSKIQFKCWWGEITMRQSCFIFFYLQIVFLYVCRSYSAWQWLYYTFTIHPSTIKQLRKIVKIIFESYICAKKNPNFPIAKSMMS